MQHTDQCKWSEVQGDQHWKQRSLIERLLNAKLNSHTLTSEHQ